ncbi:hypothetical protein GNP80_18420 [Aliivibrio fischeri]|uniref:hypothetical protein n=1 Tax=Aliivibrio fischeri TaxID=668 RepID=UPI0012DA4CE9|nr:hypothetical protein [Aliivibrio fischeri]MUK94402.1 hypothetical protein [Aliivibrio fischeri]
MPLNIPKPTRFIQAGYKPVDGGFEKTAEEIPETAIERAARHSQERREYLTFTEIDEARWARNRAGVSADEVNRKVDNWLFPCPVVKKFDEQVRLKTPQGKPISNQPYFISTAQRTYQGISDSNGCLPRIPTNEKEDIRIYLGVSALEKWV